MGLNISNNKGSVTVEAAVTFPLFLCFLSVLLLVLKTVAVSTVLDHAVNDTIKQLSSVSYLVAFINELEDEAAGDAARDYTGILREELAGFRGNAAALGRNVIQDILKGDFQKGDAEKLLGSLQADLKERAQSALGRFLTKTCGDDYLKFKSHIKQAAVLSLLKSNLSGKSIAFEKLTVVYSELPQSRAEYLVKNKDPGFKTLYSKLGFKPFKDDSILVVRYEHRIDLPIFGRLLLTTEHKAIERSWLKGSVGSSVTQWPENIGSTSLDAADLTEDDLKNTGIVYVTRTGTRYHSFGCSYLEKSRLPLKLDEAKSQGYVPCRVCITRTAKPIGSN